MAAADNGQQQQAAGQGQPAADAPAEPEPGTVSEKLFGGFGVLCGLAIAAIGLDLITGGALSRLFGLGPVDDDRQPG